MIQRIVAAVLLALLFLSTGAAMAGPDTGLNTTLEAALDSSDEPKSGDASLEAPELGCAPSVPALLHSSSCAPRSVEATLPAPPYLEGPQRPPRAR